MTHATMKNKAVIAAIIVILLIGGYIVYLSKQKPTVDKVSSSPIVERNVAEENTGRIEDSTISVALEKDSDEVIFHNNTGYSFKSYIENDVVDKIIVSKDNNEVLLLGVNWLGYTSGTLGLQKVVLVKNPYIGDLYRATGGGIADGGYVLASKVKTSGKCTNDGTEVTVPCTDYDQITGKNNTFTYLTFCLDIEAVASCDELMNGLEIK